MSREGLVMRSTGSWYEVLSEKQVYQCRVRGKLKLKGTKVTNPVAVGDKVLFHLEDDQQNQGIILDILPRENYIIRKSPHKTSHGHILAANLDQAICIITIIFPKTSIGFIDRFLVAAESFRIPAMLVFNKKDLYKPQHLQQFEDLQKIYEPLGYPCQLISAKEENGMDEFRKSLQSKKTLISGHSGVGKSTILNKLYPSLQLRTSEVSTFADKGVHTTTFAEMFQLDSDSFVIDTPGIKELGLIDIEQEEVSHFFPEMRALLGECKFHNCQHLHEPGCAVIAAVDANEISVSRYYSYLSMIEDEDNRR